MASTSSASQKPIIFLSSFCEHCQSANNLLLKYNIRQLFVVFNVDKHGDKIPPMIRSVPSILLPTRAVLEADMVFEFIENIIKEVAVQDVSAYYAQDMGSGISDSFSYLEETSADAPSRDGPFALLREDSVSLASQNNTMGSFGTPMETRSKSKSGNSGMDTSSHKTLDNLRMEREQDLKQIFSGPRPV